MYLTTLKVLDWILITLMGISFVLLIYKIFSHIYGLMPERKFPKAKVNHKFCILIPARNESKVIRDLLESLKAQNYPSELFDTYVIVESIDDPTVDICKEYNNVTCFVRPNLNVKSKGGALDQIVKHLINTGIAKEKGYEAYMIFDADNVVMPNFLEEMNKTYDAGYGIALAYRNAKNWNDGWIASCSALTFSMVNTYQNKCRARFNQNVLVSGTGFYIKAQVLHDLGGWPFQTLTEDAEISYYSVLNGIKGAYNANTQFFDEQPRSLKISWNQRIRWVKGYMQVTKKYTKKLVKSTLVSNENRWGKLEFVMGTIPLLVPIASWLLYIIAEIITGIVGIIIKVDMALWLTTFEKAGIAILSAYVFLVAYTIALLISEKKHINITIKNSVITALLNPIFLASWLPIGISAIFKKEVKWKPIERKDRDEKDITSCNLPKNSDMDKSA